ncbi:hypothetical protein [Prevotella intermedia]|uniref:hypothetical protein n=1 Tax=Prevotella intermedia TaxID=28131 RepID=UPI0015D4928B|nr:hypothetical protein [Prevotella intermedia]
MGVFSCAEVQPKENRSTDKLLLNRSNTQAISPPQGRDLVVNIFHKRICYVTT